MIIEKKRRKKRPAWQKIVVAAVSVAAWIGVWQLFSMKVGQELLLPSPVSVAKRLWELLGEPQFAAQVFGSLGRILEGFLLALAAGSVLSVVMFLVPLFGGFMKPLLTVVKATPVPSFIILALVWMESDRMPVFIAFLMVLPVVCANITEGLSNVDVRLEQMARVYRVKGIRLIGTVWLPSVYPYAAAAARTGLGLAWKAGVAAEVIGRTKDSIGLMLYESKLYIETTDLFAYTAVVVLLSCALELILRGAERLASKKRGESEDDKA